MPCVCVCMHAPCFVFKSASAVLDPRQTRGPPLAKTPAKEYERGKKLNNNKPPFFFLVALASERVGRSCEHSGSPKIPS